MKHSYGDKNYFDGMTKNGPKGTELKFKWKGH